MCFYFIFSVPPERPTIVDSRGSLNGTQIGPMLEGDNLVLNCRVSGGKSLISFYTPTFYIRMSTLIPRYVCICIPRETRRGSFTLRYLRLGTKRFRFTDLRPPNLSARLFCSPGEFQPFVPTLLQTVPTVELGRLLIFFSALVRCWGKDKFYGN